MLPRHDILAVVGQIVMLLLLGHAPRPLSAADTELVHVTDLNGRVHTGKLSVLNETQVQLDSDPVKSFPRGDILRLDWNEHSSGLLEDSPQLLLANGDRLGILPHLIDEESLHGTWFHFDAWPELKIPLETVRGAILMPQRGLLDRARLIARLHDQKEKQDVFHLLNGDRLPGQLESLQDKTFKLRTATGMNELPFGSVRAFGTNPELTSFPAFKGPQTLISLEDGSQVTVNRLELQKETELHCRTAFDVDLILPLTQVVAIRFLGGRIVPLSDLTPAEYVSTPYLNRLWPLRRNQNAIGGPLRLGDREYARGLGMHGQTVCTYDLKGEFNSVQAVIGIDAITEGRGSVIFQILGDGKALFTSKILRGKSPPLQTGILSVQGVKRLTLKTDFADEGDILDHADWCDALLIRTKSP